MTTIDGNLIAKLRECRAGTPQAMATDLIKFNQIAEIDYEMALVRARRAIDLLVRNLASQNGIVAGTKPLDQLLIELVRNRCIPPVIERHCRIVKDFGNLAAHGIDADIAVESGASLTIAELELCAESTTSVIRWYIDTIATQLSPDVPFLVKTGAQINRQMIDEALAIDALVYPDHLRGIVSHCYAWLDRNPDIYTLLIDPCIGRVVGYINAMPLEADLYRDLEGGNRIDVDFPASAIRKFDLPDFYLLYFCSIALHPSYHTTTAFKALYDAFIDKLLDLAHKEVFITEILADAVTSEGVRLCEYAGMKSVRDSNHQSTIYKTSLLPPALRVTSIKAKALTVFYQRKYEEFRSLLP